MLCSLLSLIPPKDFFYIPIDANSQFLTAMLTPYGIYIYNVLAMGLADVTDIFETVIIDLLKELNGVLNIADDVLVFGNTYDSFRDNVISFLDCCVKEDIHLNPDKIQIDYKKFPFFGHTVSKDGAHPDKAKVDLIQNWPLPQNVKELQSFVGTVNYLSKFLAFPSDLHAPLQGLLKKDAEFHWTETHIQAFNWLKEHVSLDISLQFFDCSKPLYIRVDASKWGIVILSYYSLIWFLGVHQLETFQTTLDLLLMLLRLLVKQSQIIAI